MSDATSMPDPAKDDPRGGRARSRVRGLLGWDLLTLAVGSLGANKLRSFLTMGGITIGVFSVVGVMTALSAVKSSIDTGLNVLGASVFQIGKFPAVQFGGGNRFRYRNRPDITYRQYQEFAERMGDSVKLTTPNFDRPGFAIRFENRATEPRFVVNGGNEFWTECYKFDIATGRNVTREDVEFGRQVVVLGHEVVTELFPDRDPIGEWVTIGTARYRVIGTFVEKGKLFGDTQDNQVLLPITRMLMDHSQPSRWGRTIEIAIQAWSAEEFEEAQELAIGAMRVVRRLQPDDPNDFEVFSNESLLEAFGKIAGVVGTGGFIISFIALVTAGVGIMNIMLVSVTERTREIGVRMSLGAKRKDILRQFLLEAVFLSNLGGAGGILLGILAGNAIAIQLGVEGIFPWLWAFVAVAICCTIGVTFGLYPAWKAARLHPVEALRYE